MPADLYWLPPPASDWRQCVSRLESNGEAGWPAAQILANARLDFLKTNALDSRLGLLADSNFPELRLAILGSSTLAHLHGGIRIAALRRGLKVVIYENDYGQYLQELLNPLSALYAFRPNVMLFALDARHATQGVVCSETGGQEEIEAFLSRMTQCWKLAMDNFNCQVIQQTILPSFPNVLGQNEHLMGRSQAAAVGKINSGLRSLAPQKGVNLVSLDAAASSFGLPVFYDAGLWHRTKQEVVPSAAPLYGELVARVIAAARGLTKKCLVLDLDNTLWGGVIGDDGLSGIVLGQGSGEGESYAAIQEYARWLSERGVVLAVCSKNTEEIAWKPFDQHTEMALRRSDISCFVANWNDKATNIRMIANRLNLGLESLVFLDDNPFERDLVRKELPMVAVPEFPSDPSGVPQTLADAGYFEGLSLTTEDLRRTDLYRQNLEREQFSTTTTNLDGYLRDLNMRLVCRSFSQETLKRTTQLINKTNQFNLTTKRYTEAEVDAIASDPSAFGLTVQLIDRFGDNGIICVVIGRLDDAVTINLDTWLMSCRVLGRQVERATLAVVAEQAKAMGACRLRGFFRPTAKNAMVKAHYSDVGFTLIPPLADAVEVTFELDLGTFAAEETFHQIERPKS